MFEAYPRAGGRAGNDFESQNILSMLTRRSGVASGVISWEPKQINSQFLYKKIDKKYHSRGQNVLYEGPN